MIHASVDYYVTEIWGLPASSFGKVADDIWFWNHSYKILEPDQYLQSGRD